MADKYHIGQKVRVIRAESRKDLIGEIVTIASSKSLLYFPYSSLEKYQYAYDVDALASPGFPAVSFPEDWLEPVYEGDTKSSWSECAWKPKSLDKVK